MLVAAGCTGSSEDQSLADDVSTTALANSQSGSIEVIRYDTGQSGDFILDGIALPDPMTASIKLSGCEQLDIVRWRLTGTVELAGEPTSGWVRFETVSEVRPMDFEVRVTSSGRFDIEVPTSGLSDLATTCTLLFPDGDWQPHTATAAVPIEGAFVWDADPGTIASLGSGLIAGQRNDPRRAWAQQHWFGPPLPFAEVLAVDKTVVGVAPVVVITERQGRGSPCQQIRLRSARARVTQSRSCTAADLDATIDAVAADAQWDSFGLLAGLTFTDQGRDYFVGSTGTWNVTIVAASTGDLVDVASALAFYDNPDGFGPDDVDDRYPQSEDDLVGDVLGDNFREVGRIDTPEGRFLVTEGPLNPAEPADYLRQIRIYLLDKAGVYWNPMLAAGGPWNRCLGAVPLGVTNTFVVVGDSGTTVERQVGDTWEVLDGAGRVGFENGSIPLDELRLLDNGGVVDCSTVVVTTLPPVVPTTTGTVPGTTDTTTPGGTTDTTTP